MDIDSNHYKRLAFVKYVFNIGVEQSKQPEPFGSIAILTFHDAVELFFRVAVAYLDLKEENKNRTSLFLEYFDLIATGLKSKDKEYKLSRKSDMKMLNEARRSLKHVGVVPAEKDRFRYDTLAFFEENTPIVFNLQFTDISLINYVRSESARTDLNKAKELQAEGERIIALDYIAIAFVKLLANHELHDSPLFDLGGNLSSISSWNIQVRGITWEYAQLIDKVGNALRAMQSAIRMNSLNLDYKKFIRFKLLTPTIEHSLDGIIYATSPERKNEDISNNDVDFCFNFVIETAVALYESDFDVRNHPFAQSRSGSSISIRSY